MPPVVDKNNIKNFINETVAKNEVTIFTKSTCPYCKKAKELFTSLNVKFYFLDLDLMDTGSLIQEALFELTGQKTVPNIFILGKFIGGYTDTAKLHAENKLLPMLRAGQEYNYDFIVIGGGSGGLAAAKEAAQLGAKVACVDFVKPSARGTTWGLGGTCVNVGCIPKKLMHQAALLKHGMDDSKDFGWTIPSEVTHNWNQMKNNIQCTDKKGKVEEVTAAYFLISTGCRPTYPDTPGVKEYAISSDDLFSLPYAPGKTLVVGASYVSLECAGFLATLGFDTTVMVRSIFLRGFDQQMADIVGNYMASHHVKFLRPCTVEKIERLQEGAPGLYRVTSKMADSGETVVGEYNTILFAIGRSPCTGDLNLNSVGVNLSKGGYILTNDDDQTSTDYIYAVGDVAEGKPELTPVAIQAGTLLSRRLFGGSSVRMDYINYPTTVFTPLEYGCIGLSEESAIAKYGEEDIEVYHQNLWPLEWTVPHREDNICYAKLICVKSLNEKVVGFHYVGPNAGEVTQGFTLGLKLGATKADFDNIVGIHPTCAEVFTTLKVTKSSAESAQGGGC